MLERSYGNYRATGAAEAAICTFLLQERVLEDSLIFRVNYCEVYQLGKQPWDGNQSYLKQAVHRVSVDDQILDIYQFCLLFISLTSQGQQIRGKRGWQPLKVLPWIASNLVSGKPWYAKLFSSFVKRMNCMKEKD